MASRGIKRSMGLVVLLVAMFWARGMAQSDCSNVIIGLASCLNYVTGSSSTPSASCCTQLASVVQSQPECLCTVLNGGGSSVGISINETLALALPGACNVQTPPVSRCNDANGPTMAADSPGGLPGGSKTIPETGVNSANGLINMNKTLHLLIGLAIFISSSSFGSTF
ncbi:Bifunctional inhibitor/lipid-transfer protein/seed storage 2S albumin superfamily protein [Euphorbia peplus]|nr:Bifunctional inhibitor/lipid-transfer protein/seed storage 2S albumin superfamily protein [Euphorbia peplus]